MSRIAGPRPGIEPAADPRSVSTRAVLLEATLESLYRYGYAGTTVARIAELSGMTRGAQMHHYKTKDQLIVAAIELLIERQSGLWYQSVHKVTQAEDPILELLELMWASHLGPTFTSSAELWIASRVDPHMQQAIHGLSIHVEAHSLLVYERMKPIFPDKKAFMDAFYTAQDAMRGAVFSAFSDPENNLEGRWQRIRPLLHSMFNAARG